VAVITNRDDAHTSDLSTVVTVHAPIGLLPTCEVHPWWLSWTNLWHVYNFEFFFSLRRSYSANQPTWISAWKRRRK